MPDTENEPSPIEVMLTQSNIQITCLEVHEDESTREHEIDSLSMRGAQREITGYLIQRGYAPVGRWEVERWDGEYAVETFRKFKLA